MAAFAACRYARKIGTVSGTATGLCKFKNFRVEKKLNSAIQSPSLSSPCGYKRRFDYREFSQFMKSNGGRLFLVDTLALVIIFMFSLQFYLLVIVWFAFWFSLNKEKDYI